MDKAYPYNMPLLELIGPGFLNGAVYQNISAGPQAVPAGRLKTPV